MNYSDLKALRENLSVYTKKSTSTALFIFLIDMTIYLGAMTGVIFFNSLTLKIICACIAGLKMASLFVLAHDAAHDNYTAYSLLNKIIGRLAFLPCYHNYSLWLIVHNRQHHQYTNLKGINSWSPFSKQEYDALPAWRQNLERLYRSLIGVSFNYMVERWWKDKFFPYKRLIRNVKSIRPYWLDFMLVSSFLICQIGFLIYQGNILIGTTVIEMLLVGFFLPFFVCSFMLGVSVYQQHTHESVPWFDNNDERLIYGQIEDVTLHVKYPRWYNLLSHNVMEHTVHHVDPRIPCYNLKKAQTELNKLYGHKMRIMKFSFSDILMTIKNCKLYDYRQHRWLDFNGVPTSSTTVFSEEVKYADAA